MRRSSVSRVNREPAVVTLEHELLEWLTRGDHEPVQGWEPEPTDGTLRCDPPLLVRVTQIARPVGSSARRFVAGFAVVHHPDGAPIAAAGGSSWLVVRSASPPGALASCEWRTSGLDPEWVDLDPWAADSGFASATDLLRAQVARAYERAAEHR